MKRYIPFLTVIAAVAVLFYSCKRDFTVAAKTTGIGSNAFLKIIHASPNFRKILAPDSIPDSVNVFLGSVKINAGFLQYGATWPTSGIGYAAVTPGPQMIRVVVNGVTNPDSITVTSFQRTLEAGKYYTLVITDSIKSPRDSSKIWIQDAFPSPTAGPGTFYLRFTHAVMDGITDTVDLYSLRRNQVFFSKIKMDSTTPFTSFSTILNSQDTVYVRKSGTGTILAKLPTITFGDQQFYSLYYAGDTAASPAAKTRALGGVQNR